MHPTDTRPVVSAVEIAKALATVAAMFSAGFIPERDFPEAAIDLSVRVATAASVRELGDVLRVTVEEHVSAAGYTHTEIAYPIGRGSHLLPDSATYSGAVVLRVYHVSDVAR